MLGDNPAMTYSNEILIRRSDCDPLGHVRTSAYLSFLHKRATWAAGWRRRSSLQTRSASGPRSKSWSSSYSR